MSEFVLQVALDGDKCHLLDTIPYSTNPRKFITVQDMLNYARLVERVEGVLGA